MLVDVGRLREIILNSIDEEKHEKARKISEHEATKSCSFDLTTRKMVIEFKIPVETEGIDLEGLFDKGGVLKKTDSKDKKEGYLKIEPIGE